MPEPAESAKKSTVSLLFLLLREKYGNLSRRAKIVIPAVILIPVLVFFAARGVFLYRSPLVVVTDSSFMTLYGPKRLRKMEFRLSYKLFRKVIPVYVGENAGPDQISLAAEDAFQKPLAVLFPHRYMSGANFYKENHPDTPVYITTGRNRRSTSKEAVTFIRTDIKTDLYRAGLCAALLAGEGTILFISDETVPNENREVFIEGLRAQDYTKNPTWGRYNSDFSASSTLSCVVIAGPVGDFFEKRPDTPVILFSLADPDFTPRSVMVVFDDSPYALALKELKLFSSTEGESEVSISSVPTVLKNRFKDRTEGKEELIKLESLVKSEYQHTPP